ncbi:hypothetical protein SK128_010544, partial [Halocaridina rubra]
MCFHGDIEAKVSILVMSNGILESDFINPSEILFPSSNYLDFCKKDFGTSEQGSPTRLKCYRKKTVSGI